VLLESELGVGDFTIDLSNFLKAYVANSMTFSQKTPKFEKKTKNFFKKQVCYTWFK